MRLTLDIQNTSGKIVEIGWDRLVGLSIVKGEHGDETLDFEALSTLAIAGQVWRNREPLIVTLSYGVFVVWRGRLEDVLLNRAGFLATAFGYWRALHDLPLVGLYSDKSLGEWKKISGDEIAGHAPERFEMDKLNRLIIQLRNGEAYYSTTTLVGWVYKAPHRASTKIQRFTFSYNYNLPTLGAAWTLRIRGYDEGFTSAATLSTLTTTGGAASGSASITGFSKDFVVIEAFKTTGSTTLAAETGVYYIKITNPRVYGIDQSSIEAQDIIADALSFLDSVNEGQIPDNAALVQSPNVDLDQAVYHDVKLSALVTSLADKGDDQSPSRVWETGIHTQSGLLYFRPLGDESRIWAVDAEDLTLQRSTNDAHNSHYGLYKDAEGRIKRTETADNGTGQARYGLVRRRAVPIDTTSNSTAAIARDAAQAYESSPAPRATGLSFSRLMTTDRADAELWELQQGDRIEIQNLPVELLLDPDEVAIFRVARVEYMPLSGDGGRLVVHPESLAPTIEAILAKTAGKSIETGTKIEGAITNR